MKILFTGFEPFGLEKINPSWEAVRRLPEEVEGVQIRRLLLPVEYDRVEYLLKGAMEMKMPDAVICVGQAGGRAAVTPEFVAINRKDAPSPDNAGVLYDGVPVDPAGPAAYFATIPVKAITAALRESGIPAAVSYSAGTYVCNSTMYRLLHLLAAEYPKVQGGFIHVPYACEQAARHPQQPSMSLETMVRALTVTAVTVADALKKNPS